MNKNTNSGLVVIDTDQFLKLFGRAEIGDRELCSNVAASVLKHAKKFNPHLKDFTTDRLQAEDRFEKEILALTKKIVHTMTGKTMYFAAGSNIVTPCTVKGFGVNIKGKKDKKSVMVKFDTPLKLGHTQITEHKSISPYALGFELDQDMIFCEKGEYAGKWVKPFILKRAYITYHEGNGSPPDGPGETISLKL